MSQNLMQRFLALSPKKRKQVHRHLCIRVVDEWQKFAQQIGQIRYIDSVVGIVHDVDFALPVDAYQVTFETSLETTKDRRTALITSIEKRYREPIVALQYEDFELPDHLLYGYYAIYNAFLKYSLHREINDWLIVNQSLSIETDQQQWQPMLAAALPDSGIQNLPLRQKRGLQEMSNYLVQEIIEAAGQPVADQTLSVQEMEQAVAEGRVLQVNYWSNFGEGEASFGFATSFGLDAHGHVHPTYLVFPKPIPTELRRQSNANWEEVEDVFAAFGVRRR